MPAWLKSLLTTIVTFGTALTVLSATGAIDVPITLIAWATVVIGIARTLGAALNPIDPSYGLFWKQIPWLPAWAISVLTTVVVIALALAAGTASGLITLPGHVAVVVGIILTAVRTLTVALNPADPAFGENAGDATATDTGDLY